MSITRRGLLPCLIVLGLARIAAADPDASADDSSAAFVLQPTVALATSVGGASTTALTDAPGVPTATSSWVPSARLGVQLRPLALLLSASYSTAGVQGKAVDTLVHVAALGEPVVWRSADERTRMYVLLGLGAVAMGAPVVNAAGGFTTASSTGVNLQIGVGGQYAINGNLSLGLELSGQVDVVDSYVASATYVAITGTFATGSHPPR